MPLALQLGFNISAPHMHTACMEALDLAPGQAVLDVGCGCGILTAMMATVVGFPAEGGRARVDHQHGPAHWVWQLPASACRLQPTAAAHVQVGKDGSVWGIDCKKRAVSLARTSIAGLEASSAAYARCAAPCTLRQHNVFLPAEFLLVRALPCSRRTLAFEQLRAAPPSCDSKCDPRAASRLSRPQDRASPPPSTDLRFSSPA